MFTTVFFDIYAGCNAKCPWCQTGSKTRQRRPIPKGAIAPKDFSRAIDYMLSEGIIGRETVIHLYNFAEPFLHPQFEEIVKRLAGAGLRFGLSTNASRLRTFSEPLLERLGYITFSMPGFSQASYNRIHGFDFETVKANIVAIAKNFRECGFRGNPYIAYHVYQFNIEEIDDACKFATDNGLGLEASYAYFNDHDMGLSYLESTMPYEQLRRASQELVLYYVEDLLAQKPPGYACPQWDVLSLNERCQVLLCCAINKNEGAGILGDLFQMDADTIRQMKRGHSLCKPCLASGKPYWSHHAYRVRKVNRTSGRQVFRDRYLDEVLFVEQPSSCAGMFESASQSNLSSLLVQGWARNPARNSAADGMLIMDDRRKVLACDPSDLFRKDALPNEGLEQPSDRQGRVHWQIRVDLRHVTPGARHLVGYAFDRTGRVAYRLANGVELQ